MSIKLSLIIPVYNVASFINKCLDSILTQDNEQIEIIIINDASPDQSDSIICAYEGSFNNCTYITNKKNIGLGESRNIGIDNARGDYLMFVDPDDWLEADAIQNVLSELDGSDLIHFGCNKVFDSHVEKNKYVTPLKNNLKQTKKLLLNHPKYVWIKIHKRSFISSHSIRFKPGLYEDIFWMLQCITYAKEISLSRHTIYNYLQRNGSILNASSTKHFDYITAYQSSLILLDSMDSQIASAFQNSIVNDFYHFINKKLSTRVPLEYRDAFIKEAIGVLKKIKTRGVKSKIKKILLYIISYL